MYNDQLRNIIEGYDIYEGQEEPLHFEDKRPENKRKPPKNKRNTEGLVCREYSSGAPIAPNLKIG
jgi:hypothetical protein